MRDCEVRRAVRSGGSPREPEDPKATALAFRSNDERGRQQNCVSEGDRRRSALFCGARRDDAHSEQSAENVELDVKRAWNRRVELGGDEGAESEKWVHGRRSRAEDFGKDEAGVVSHESAGAVIGRRAGW